MELLKSIPCEYNGILMRSFLEKRIAEKLDECFVRWWYEPQGFKMSDGTCYCPDFYLPDLKMWIEGKGVMTEKDKHKCNCFVRENEKKEPLMIVSFDGEIEIMGAYLSWCREIENIFIPPIEYKFYKDFRDTGFTGGLSSFAIFKCRECGRYYVCSEEDDYTCLHCGAYDGDHHREVLIRNGENFFSLQERDFKGW